MSSSTIWTRRYGGLASMDTFVAYQPKLEDAILPQPETILNAICGTEGLLRNVERVSVRGEQRVHGLTEGSAAQVG